MLIDSDGTPYRGKLLTEGLGRYDEISAELKLPHFGCLQHAGYADHPDVPCHNNSVEQQIKHYAIGRKCWFFCYDKVDAQASATRSRSPCRANDVDRFEYFRYIFEHLPMATTLEALLLWTVKPIPEERRKQREAALRSAALN